jgi:hypothetical protein
MGDQGQVFGRLRTRHRQFRGHVPRPRALDRQRRLQRVDIVGQVGKSGGHDHK